MGKKSSFEKTCKILAIFNVGFLLLLLCYYIINRFAVNSDLTPVFSEISFFTKKNRFADFYNPIQYAMDRNLTNDYDTDSPPFMHLCAWGISLLIRLVFPGRLQNSLDSVKLFRKSISGAAMWIVIMIVYMILFCKGFQKLFDTKENHGKQKRIYYIFAVLSVFVSYPFLWAMDRGNFVLFVALLILYALSELDTNPRMAAVLIGLAAAMKIYPAIMGLLFLKKKDWKSAIVCAATGIGVTLFSLFVFSTNADGVGFMATFSDWFHKLTSYTAAGNGRATELIIWNNSFMTLGYFISEVLLDVQDMELFSRIVDACKSLIGCVFAVSVFGCFFLKKRHDIILILSVLMVAFPTYSATYNMILVAIPFLFWLSKEKDNIIPIVTVLLLTNKAIIIYYVENMDICVTLNSLLNPLLLLFTIVYVYCRRIRLHKSIEE